MAQKRQVPRDVALARSRLAILTRSGADPEVLEEVRAELRAANARAAAVRAAARKIAELALSGSDGDVAI